MLFDAEDEGRAAAGKLQRWGLEAQEKWGDGDWEKDQNTPMSAESDQSSMEFGNVQGVCRLCL